MEERRLILAFALSFAVLMGFRLWTNSRYPQTAALPATSASASPTQGPGTGPATEASRPNAPAIAASPAPTTKPTAPVVAGEERRVELTFKDAEIAFSSKGARLLSWKLLDYKDQRGKPVEAHPGGNPSPGPLDLVTGRADLDGRIREALFRSTSLDAFGEKGARFEFSDGSLEVMKTIQSIKGGRAFRVDATVREAGVVVPARVYWGPGFGQASDEERSLRGYLPPDVVQVDENGAEVRIPVTGLSAPRAVQAKLIGVENKYFVAVMTREDGAPLEATASAQTEGKESHVQILVPLPVALTVGAKDYDRLQSLGLGVEKIVPVGSWLGPIVVPLTRALRAVNARVGNYGLAIILLTMAIGVTLAPLRHYAILSSAKMAKVAPQIRAVQERYKRLSLTDPKRQQMQQEIAEVYEKNGIDMIRQTAAGCLPTLLTMPFLFAFYRMLDISVDLKGAPFFLSPI